MREENPLSIIMPVLIIAVAIAGAYVFFQGSIGPTMIVPVDTVIAGLFFFLTMIDIRIGMALFMLSVGFSPEFTIFGIPNLRLEDPLAFILLLSWLFKSLKERESLIPCTISAPYLWLVAIGVLSTLMASLSGFSRGYKPFLVLGKMIEYYVIFLIFMNNIRRPGDARAFIILLIITATLAAAHSAYAARNDTAALNFRIVGPYGEGANIFGGYVVMNLVIAIGLYYHATNGRARAGLALIMILMFYIMLFTHSRTSFVAFFGSVLVFGVLKRHQSLGLFALLIVLFLVTAPDTVLERVSTIFSIGVESGPSAWRARVSSWEDYSSQGLDQPVFGRGLGSVNLGDVDNEYVRVFADTGLLGLVAFCWFLLAIRKGSAQLYDLIKENGMLKGFAGGYVLCFYAVALHGLGSTTFTAIRTMETFMIISGIYGAIHFHYPDWSKEHAGIPPEEYLIGIPEPPPQRGPAEAGRSGA